MRQVQHRIEEQVGIIELHNPPHQFMTSHMLRELDELTSEWEHDPKVRAIIITATQPGTFITHFSIEELGQGNDILPAELPRSLQAAIESVVRGFESARRLLPELPAVRRALESTPIALRALFQLNQIHRVLCRLERMDKAVIAAINGTAMGGGCELALSCDYRLMARGDHVIGLVEVLGAVIPGAGGTQRLSAVVGRGKAIELLLDGTVLSPDEAERIGLITRAVPAEQLMDEAMKLARRLATRPLTALGHAKRAVRLGASLPLDDGLAFEKLSFVLSGIQPDARKLTTHYLERFGKGQSPREIFEGLRERGVTA